MYTVGISSVLCERNYVKCTSVFSVWRITVIINLVWLFSLSMAVCPPQEDLQKTTQACFREYSTQKTYVDRSEHRLFSGIDIEILRAYCTSYLNAVQCVKTLLIQCPESSHSTIHSALASYQNVQKELNDLCRTHGLYEMYAQYMTCFTDRGHKSDICFDSKIDVSFPYTLSSEELCSKMKVVTRCIEKNIRNGCGEQAAELVHLLVKPTVRGSGQCVYNVYHNSQTSSTTRTQISDSSGVGGGRTGGTLKTAERSTSERQPVNNVSVTLSSNHILTVICIYTSLAFNLLQLLKPRGLS